MTGQWILENLGNSQNLIDINETKCFQSFVGMSVVLYSKGCQHADVSSQSGRVNVKMWDL